MKRRSRRRSRRRRRGEGTALAVRPASVTEKRKIQGQKIDQSIKRG